MVDSLCNLGVLCVSMVKIVVRKRFTTEAENTENAQRLLIPQPLA